MGLSDPSVCLIDALHSCTGRIQSNAEVLNKEIMLRIPLELLALLTQKLYSTTLVMNLGEE